MIVSMTLVSVLLAVMPAGSPRSEAIETIQAAFEAGRYRDAVATLTNAISNSPKDAALHYWAMRSYYELGDFENAVAFGETAVSLEPKSAEYHRWLGRAYGAKAEKSHSFFLARKVKQAFEQAVHLAPGSIPARRDLMQYLCEAPWIVGGDKEKALEQIAIITRLDPLEGHLARGAFFATDKQWKEAEAEYAVVLD